MFTKEQAFSLIEALVSRFTEQYDSYKSAGYNETLTRHDFIDPFFMALGWDVNNQQGYAEAYREVIHEDKIKVAGATKAPDYSFRLPGGKKLFFVEAKKPSVVVKDEILPAYQVRRYGWSAKLPVSIITDFEEFAIYDCTKKPNPTDKASVARISYFTYKDYIKEFDFLWDTFSKERVLKGSFDKFVQTDTRKKGTATVDKEFLLSLDNWRTYLAKSISWNNKNLDEDEINFAVQQTIDRIIFLRIAEDRNVEPYGNLKSAINSPFEGGRGDVNGSYKNLFRLFTEADQKYNSGLFDISKDKISSTLQIDNKVIKTIITELYYPESPFEFSVLPVEILGTAYEQFLGKVIRITPGHIAKVEEKPEVRKAGGVYYTPQYIVDYIVKNTVGRLIDSPHEGVVDMSPNDVSKLKILDPACGSGSFLIGAYQYLLDWHKNYYTEHGKPAKGKKESPLTPEGNLTTAEKKRILLNNIYGVDIDVNAVEVTKLSLLLKCMEGETSASIAYQLSMFHERVLPSLENNIKDGNSLIDTDYYAGELDLGFDKKIKPFNWQKAFPEVFEIPKLVTNQELKLQYQKVKKLKEETDELIDKYSKKVEEPVAAYKKTVGFDIVIGNPPYGALFIEPEITYFKNRFFSSIWRNESYLLFIEQGLKLLREDGHLGFIIPDTLLNLGFTQSIREYLLRNSKLIEVDSLPSNVFMGTTVDTILLFTQKKYRVNTFHSSNIEIKVFNKKKKITAILNPDKFLIASAKDWFLQNSFNVHADDIEHAIIKKMEKDNKTIEQIAEMFSGIKTYEIGKGNPPQTKKIRDSKPFTSISKFGEEWSPFYDGKHIGRYQLIWNNNNWIKYGNWLAAPRNPENFIDEKILIRKIIGKTLIATYIPFTSYCNTLLFVLKLRPDTYQYKSMLGLLNSFLLGWYFRKKFQISDEDTFPQIMIRDLLQFPIPNIEKNNETELINLVDQLLLLNEEKQQTKLETKLNQIQGRIDYYEDRINQIVYELYGLTEEEVEIVKESVN